MKIRLINFTFLVWALVYFREEGVLILSHPIRLEEIQDLNCLVVLEWKLISKRGISVWPYVTLETSGVKQFFYSDDQVSFEFQNQKWWGGGGYHLLEIKREKGMHDVGNFGIQFYLNV